MYLRIDASLYSVDEVRPQAFHLSKPDSRHYVLAHHHGGDEFLRVLLGRHTQQSTGWPEREAHQVRIVLLQQDREDRRRASAQRVPHQDQPELMRAPRGILQRNPKPFLINSKISLIISGMKIHSLGTLGKFNYENTLNTNVRRVFEIEFPKYIRKIQRIKI